MLAGSVPVTHTVALVVVSIVLVWQVAHICFLSTNHSTKKKIIPCMELSDAVLKVKKKLGFGGFGKVYLVQTKPDALSSCMPTHAALKVMYKERLIISSRTKKKREEWKKEITIHSQLDHPFILKMLDYFQTRHSICLLLEHAPGGHLGKQMFMGFRMGVESARFYTMELICAIHYMHSKNFVHRDLKLSNVLLTREGHVRLADFGLSTTLEDGCLLCNSCGTLPYMAPELFEEPIMYGKGVDWWALGVMVFLMLNGCEPFEYGAWKSTEYIIDEIKYRKHLEWRKEFHGTPVKDFVEGLLNKNPDKRLGSNGMDEIYNHPWFEGVIWDDVINGNIEPPKVPNTWVIDRVLRNDKKKLNPKKVEPNANKRHFPWQKMKEPEDVSLFRL